MISTRVLCALLLAAAPAPAATVKPYLEVNGKPAAPDAVRVSQDASRITVEFRAPADGTYRFGVVLEAAHLAPLTPGKIFEPGVDIFRYPYDWTYRGQANVLTMPRLVTPGVEADGRIYIVDTHELYSITLPRTGGALLLAHRFYNDGADRSTADLPLHAGDRRELTILIFADIPAANRARFGDHLAIPPGNRVQVPFREWADASLSAEQYRHVAHKLQGIFSAVDIREREPLAYIPPIFHELGMRVFDYQYLGALRRRSTQVTPEIEREIALRDTAGRIMTAPRPLDANWLLGDIRRAEVRARFVANARLAIHNGFDGVFLDGYPFWTDPNGDIGGNAPGAEHSWAYARWQLLREMKAAIRAENPKAILGALANQYFDSLGEADVCEKERMYFEWEDKGGAKNTGIRKDLDTAYEEREAPYIAGAIVYGVKGSSPLSVQSSRHFVRHPTGLWYTDDGDFLTKDMEPWLDAVVATMQPSDFYISDIEPASCWVHFEGLTTIHTDDKCTITLSKPACVTRQPGGPATASVTRQSLEPGVRYDVSRACAGQ